MEELWRPLKKGREEVDGRWLAALGGGMGDERDDVGDHPA